MGCFDTLKISYPLPPVPAVEQYIKNPNDLDFQTKDLSRGMGNYEIRKNGRIYQILKKTEYCTEEEVNYYDTHPILYHGDLNFYTLEDFERDSVWLEYNAKIECGVVNKIELVIARINYGAVTRLNDELNKMFNRDE